MRLLRSMRSLRSTALSLVFLSLAWLPLPGASRPANVATIPEYTYRVVNTYPHDVNAFTQGLFYKDGFLYESTGLLGRSTVRKVKLTTGEVLQSVGLPADVFGEGIAHWKDQLIGLTWQSQIGYVLKLDGLAYVGRFSYVGEGWGLTQNDRELIMSDGTPELRFVDPTTLRETRRLRVTADGAPVHLLNELEWVDGEIFANVWQTDRIARISPKTGKVIGWIDLSAILADQDRIKDHTDALNGIAYDAKTKRLFVTGKFWPKIFEIRLVPAKAR